MATRFPNVRVIGGEGVGGAAVIGQLFAAAQRKNYPIISAFLVYHRRENGLKVVSNVPPSGTDVIVVYDVATTGHALGIARDFVPQCNVVAGAVIIDRSQGDAERNLGFPVISVFSESAFVDEMNPIANFCCTKFSSLHFLGFGVENCLFSITFNIEC